MLANNEGCYNFLIIINSTILQSEEVVLSFKWDSEVTVFLWEDIIAQAQVPQNVIAQQEIIIFCFIVSISIMSLIFAANENSI